MIFMKERTIFVLMLLILTIGFANADNRFMQERELQDKMMASLIRFSEYLKNDYLDIDGNYGCFKGENTMGNDEKGVRTNIDLSMVSAFLVRYAPQKATFPAGVTRAMLDTIAYKTLSYAIDTHNGVRRYKCKNGKYWGSVDKHNRQWESSLWALSVAYSAWFQWNKLTEEQKGSLYKLMKAECNYELQRDIPTGFIGDTKAEENGWETDVLAAAIGLFPNDSLAPEWFMRMREFAVNSYSHPSDKDNSKVIDEWFDDKSVSDLYKGANLYEDWTLQNHDFFHTSYQNVVIQELGEAALAMHLFQTDACSRLCLPKSTNFADSDSGKWSSLALLHNCDKVSENVLNWLTLPDGEQAMPNGNDWSLFLYDQITSYSTLACMMKDKIALYFEQQAMKQILHRQTTTKDGTWLLRADVGGRRMGVEAHRIMMSWLMHNQFSTAKIKPVEWSKFSKVYSKCKLFPCQNIVRTLDKDYFACFSFSKGKKSYTGYFVPLNLDNNNLVVPFRIHNSGNLIGYYVTEGNKVNSRLKSEPIITPKGKYFEVKAELIENDGTLLRTFVMRTSEKGLEYSDEVTALADVNVVEDKSCLLAISTDEFTRKQRKVVATKGKTIIDDLLVVTTNGGKAEFADKKAQNSVFTTKLYPFMENSAKSYKRGDNVAKHHYQLSVIK